MSEINYDELDDDQIRWLEAKEEEEFEAEAARRELEACHAPLPVVPVRSDKLKSFTLRFRESGYDDLRCIAQVKGSQLFGNERALDLSMIIRMALEAFIAREK